MAQTRVIVEQHLDKFIIHDPSGPVISSDSTLEGAISKFKKFYQVYRQTVSKIPDSELLDVYITALELDNAEINEKESIRV